MIVHGKSEEIAAWVGARIPHVGADGFGECGGMWVSNDNGRTIAGVVFHEWQPEARHIQLSMAADSPMWAKPETIARLLAYPFRQLDVWMVYTATPADNCAALKVNEHIGLIKPIVIGHWFGPGRHGVQRRMLRPEFESRYGQYLNPPAKECVS